MVARETEKCDRLEGFVLPMSVAGGTGSGVGTRITEGIQSKSIYTTTQSAHRKTHIDSVPFGAEWPASDPNNTFAEQIESVKSPFSICLFILFLPAGHVHLFLLIDYAARTHVNQRPARLLSTFNHNKPSDLAVL